MEQYVARTFIKTVGLCIIAALLQVEVGVAQVIPTEVEGSSGGGLSPWAVLAPSPASLSFTNVNTQDFHIRSISVGAALAKRFEVSFGTQIVDAPTVGNALKLSDRINMYTAGLKWELIAGRNAVPTVSIGVQVKHVSGSILDALQTAGAISSTSGVDYYLAATEVVHFLGRNVIVNGTLRATKANQFGLLGFGGGSLNGHDGYQIVPEVSAGAFITKNIAVGGEYRVKPNNISQSVFGIQEGAANDLFVAFFPNKKTAITAAFADLGQIGPSRSAVPAIAGRQTGFYIQLQSVV